MKRIFCALAALALFLPATAQTSKAVDVSVDFFYNNLSGGNWIEVGDYGYCWQPDIAVSDTSWRPYADGYWAYTDLGWTWVSYEDFGWATYHYGRWTRLADYGWIWVPGRDEDLEWGPAWVSWRTGGEYIGWAPLPPETIGVVYRGRPITGHLDVEFNIGPGFYNFVDVRYIGEPVLRERIVATTQNVIYINQTVNVTNITYKNKVVYNYGPDVTVIDQHAARPIQRLKIERQENADVSAALRSGSLLKPQGDKLVVAAPMHIKKAQKQMAPPTVKTRVEKAKLDRGWSVVGDEKAQTELRQKIKSQDLKKVPPITSSAGGGATAGGSPAPEASASASAGANVSPLPETAAEDEKGKHKNKQKTESKQNALTEAASPNESAAPVAGKAGETTERGKHKGKHGENAKETPAASDSMSPSEARSAGEETSREPGKHKGKLEEKRGEQEPTPESMSPKKGASDATSMTGAASGETTQAGDKHKGKQTEKMGGPPTVPEPMNPPGGGRNKARGERASGQQPGNAPAGGIEEYPRGEGKGKHGNKKGEEPAGPTPQQ